MKKVDFFIVGAPKAGTTSLYHYLNEHKDIEMSSQKEPDFFSDDSLQQSKLYYGKNRIDTLEKYQLLFKREDAVLRGDASVSYLFYKDVPSKIYKYNSAAKIIIMLRNPIDRAFSHYLMDYRLGLISESFDKIIKKQSKHKNAHLFYQQYIQVSEYSKQIKRYLEVFSNEDIYFIDYDDFRNKTSEVVNNVFLFLALDNNFYPNLTKKYNTYADPRNRLVAYLYSFVILRKILAKILPINFSKTILNIFFVTQKKPKLCEDTRNSLKKYFERDVTELSELLNIDFRKWIK